MTLVRSLRKHAFWNGISKGRVEKKLRLPVTTVLSSDFFSVALKREWKESITKTVQLPDIDVLVFRIYFNWLYSGPHLNITEKDDRVYPTADATTKPITEESSTAAEEPQSIDETPSIDHE
ncbi:hypothetical protein N0V94_003138 [Neodidymelliopsis sp. IMI 364377]|nr:hypothetical protein N0V94_003138 [Neodidymelliopsis sp. IMI 364377]